MGSFYVTGLVFILACSGLFYWTGWFRGRTDAESNGSDPSQRTSIVLAAMLMLFCIVWLLLVVLTVPPEIP